MDRPEGFQAWVVRTHFEDEAAWQQLVADVTLAGSSAEVVSDVSFRDATWSDVASRFRPAGHGVAFVADVEGMRGHPHGVLVVDLIGGLSPFRSEASATAEIEINLLTDNLGFEDFGALARSQGGTFRGTLGTGAASEAKDVEHGWGKPRRRSPVVRRKARTGFTNEWPKDLIVGVPSEALGRLVLEQQRRGVPLERLLHERVLRDVLGEEKKLAAPEIAATSSDDSEVPVTIQVSMVLHDLVTIGARSGRFTTVEEYCSAALRTIAALL
jgi:hypothetical protein